MHIEGGGVVVGYYDYAFPTADDVGDDVEDGLCFPCTWRSLNNADLMFECGTDGRFLTGVATEGEDKVRVVKFLWFEVGWAEVARGSAFDFNEAVLLVEFFQDTGFVFSYFLSDGVEGGHAMQILHQLFALRGGEAVDFDGELVVVVFCGVAVVVFYSPPSLSVVFELDYLVDVEESSIVFKHFAVFWQEGS